jgi:hypothetical protein
MRNMRRPVIITAPFATPEETARISGIPKRRAEELRKMVEDSLAKKGKVFVEMSRTSSSKNGASRSASRSDRLRADQLCRKRCRGRNRQVKTL